MHRTGDALSKRAPALDPLLLAIASLASLCSAVIASAFGTGPVATLIVAAGSPWIVAFISHPGPRRRRRVGAVLLLAGLVDGTRTGLARAASYIRHPRDRDRRRARERAPSRSAVGRSVPRRVSLAAATAACAVAVCAVCLTVPELVFGAAVVADRPLTLVPIAQRQIDGPGARLLPPDRQRARPTLSVPGRDVRRLATGLRGARVTYRVVAHDARGAALTPDCRPGSGRFFTMGETRVECVARQANGLSVRRAFTVRVIPVMRPGGGQADARAPRVTTPGDIVREVVSQGAVRVTFAVSAIDAVDGSLTPSCRPQAGAMFPVGATRVTCSAIDSSGNVGRASFTVTVRLASSTSKPDNTPPRLSLPNAVHARASTPLGALVTYVARAHDARDGALGAECVPRSGTRFAIGGTPVTCTATDRTGNTARGAFVVVVSPIGQGPDRTAPDITVPRSVRAQAPRSADVSIRYRAVAVDDRDGRVAVTCSPPSGSTFPVGVTRVSCSASDRAGNVARRTFPVVVLRASGEAKPPDDGRPDQTPPPRDDPTTTPSDADTTAPRIGAFKVPSAVADTPDGAVVTYRPPSATDDRDGRVPVDCAPPSGSRFRVGETTVICTAHDQAGNTSKRSASAIVRLVDTRPPRIDPFTIPTVTAPTREGAIVTYDAPSAIDDRDGPVPVTCDPPSSSRFRVGSWPVTCTARDSAGNTATQMATATVELSEIG